MKENKKENQKQALKLRGDIPVELTWDLSSIYAAEEAMYQDVEKVKALCDNMVQTYKNKLDTPQHINACLDDFREVNRLLTLIVHYCDLAVSVDYYDTHNQERNEAIASVTADVTSRLSFIDNEIAAQEDAVIRGRLRCPRRTGTIYKIFCAPSRICFIQRQSVPSRHCHAPFKLPTRFIIWQSWRT